MARASIAGARPANPRAREFRFIMTASFMVFLLAAIVTRFLPASWRLVPQGPGRRRSIIAEARAATNTFVPYAFMG